MTSIPVPQTGFSVRLVSARSPGLARTLPKAPSARLSSARVSLPKTGAYELQKTNVPAYRGSRVVFQGIHHVALICGLLERSLDFYCGVLGLEVNPDRPDGKLPYRGTWLWIGPDMIHLMELPNPDPSSGRPVHGGRDRHFCVGVENIATLENKLSAAGIEFTRSMSGRPAVFFRDPDANCLECVELEEPWR